MKKIICWLLFHDLVVVHSCSPNTQKLLCKRCERFFGINHSVRVFIPWTPDLEMCDDYKICSHGVEGKYGKCRACMV